MGTILFWLTWISVVIFYSVTTPRQRRDWFWLVWAVAICCVILSSILNAAAQGYLTAL